MSAEMTVQMTCMTTKNKFMVDNPEVRVLRNGRFAYRAECPWKGKPDKDGFEKTLHAWKFCSKKAYETYQKSLEAGNETDGTQISDSDE